MSKYFLALGVFLIAASVYGAYVRGDHNGYARKSLETQVEITKQQAEIAELKSKSSEVSLKIVTKYRDKLIYIKQRGGDGATQVAKKVTEHIDCVLPDSFRLLHNAQIPDENLVSDSPGSIDGVATETPSSR